MTLPGTEHDHCANRPVIRLFMVCHNRRAMSPLTDHTGPTTPATPPVAVLWDFDGTLVDTQPIWVDVDVEIVAELGGVFTREDGAQLAGRSWRTATGILIDAIGDPSIDPWQLYERRFTEVTRRIRESDIVFLPGARELLEALYEADIPCGLVSASPQLLLDAVLDRMPAGRFAAIVDGDAIIHGKPAPDGFLTCAQRLGVDAADCLVIEDSPVGCQSGRRSGAVVLGVPCLTPLPRAPRQVLRGSLAGMDVDDVRKIWAIGAASS